jgi:probable F420-dependent oxidoreductase
MHYGVMMFSTDYAIHPAELGRAAEERGFESLLFPEHTHIPSSRSSPWPGGPNLPKEYWHTNDVFVALSFAAAATSTLRIGTGICLVIEHDPITLAKQVATLDALSGGRLIFGIGGGWNREEMENHGTDFTQRWDVLRERIAAMKEIWTKDEASYRGEHVSFDAIWSWPKPVQKPHPPILLGSGSARGRQRVVDYCDGWMPIAGRATCWPASPTCASAPRGPGGIRSRSRSRSSARPRRPSASTSTARPGSSASCSRCRRRTAIRCCARSTSTSS